uniref:DUF5658 domain-containing protein n=1 Tax=Thermus tengchongensis TaxID=1214928 RepID=A0A7V4A0S5_9DEIN
MPFLLIGVLTVYTLALALGSPEVFREAWLYALVYYGVSALGDTWTTLEGLRRGYREGNPLYARALSWSPWGIFLVDLGLLSLKVVFLSRLGFDPTVAYPVALVIGGHGHAVGFLWNLGFVLPLRK